MAMFVMRCACGGEHLRTQPPPTNRRRRKHRYRDRRDSRGRPETPFLGQSRAGRAYVLPAVVGVGEVVVDDADLLPACGASIVFPSPIYIPTWWMPDGVPLLEKNRRSPGRRRSRVTFDPASAY